MGKIQIPNFSSSEEKGAAVKKSKVDFEDNVSLFRDQMFVGLNDRVSEFFEALDEVKDKGEVHRYAALFLDVAAKIAPRSQETELKVDYTPPIINMGVKALAVDPPINKFIENKEVLDGKV